jgi:hypothetical protein
VAALLLTDPVGSRIAFGMGFDLSLPNYRG